MTPTERWELLGVRTLAARDSRAEEFEGVLLIQRVGGTEPVERIEVVVKRSVLDEIRRDVDRLLRRSTGLGR
jgi:hypothetical protein